MKDNVFSKILSLIIGLSLLLGVVFLVSKVSTPNVNNTNIPPPSLNFNTNQIEPSPIESDFDKYLKFKNNGNYIQINEEGEVSPDFTPNDTEINNQIALNYLNKNSHTIIVDDGIKSGYLYIKAAVDSPLSPLEENESLYIYLQRVEDKKAMGGHLFKIDNLASPISTDGKSQFLYSLDKLVTTYIPYNDSNETTSLNWLSLLNSEIEGEKEYYIGGFVSANRFAIIEEIIIAYDGDAKIEKKY